MLIEPLSSWHEQVIDILIENGKIVTIAPNIVTKNAKVISFSNLHVSVGWMDVGTQVGEPGLEHREDLQSVTQAAAVGGFTAIAPFPNTQPVIHNRIGIQLLKNFAKHNVVDILPLGAITHQAEGKDIAEMYDMHQTGAIAFSDGKLSIQHTGVMLRALEYVKFFEGIVLNHPYDQVLAGDGQMHEGAVSTRLGLPGLSRLTEELMLHRDLELLAYTNSRLHVYNISTALGVEMIRSAKAKGLQVSASVSAMHLLLSHENLEGFNVNCKVHPPLREISDQAALIAGLKDGTIDIITSNHVPLETEAKMVEFPYAKAGAIGLETAFAVAHTALQGQLDLAKIINLFAHQPRKLFNVNLPSIEIGAVANLTLFAPTAIWNFDVSDIRSKSKNTPFLNYSFTGKVWGIIRENEVILV